MGQENVSEVMLNGCLSSSYDEVLKYSKKWDQTIDIDKIDFRGMRLAPYYLNNLKKFGVKSKYEKRLKVLYQYWWLKTKFLQDQLQIICNKLANNGIEPMVFKGCSLMYYYEKPELRPMSDIDIFVPYNKIHKTFQVLQDLGYNFIQPFFKLFFEKYPKMASDFMHAITFRNEKLNVEVDLHWKIGGLISSNLSDVVYNEKIQHQEIRNAFSLNVAHEVLATILHAEISNSRDNLNWILDINKLVKKTDSNDWNTILNLAKKENKSEFLYRGVEDLQKFGVNIDIFKNLKNSNKQVYLNVYDFDVKGTESKLQRIIRKNKNSWNSVICIFPSSHLFNKFFQYLRIIRFQYLYSKIVR